MHSEPIFQTAPFRFAHGASLAITPSGLLAVWFAGLYEGHPGTAIWSARRDGGRWSAPRKIAEAGGAPCWNPVPHQVAEGPLLLFFRAGPDPFEWTGLSAHSDDDGQSWSAPEPLSQSASQSASDIALGPIRAKPLALSDGALLCPSSRERRRDGAVIWTAHMERYEPEAGVWTALPPLDDPMGLGAIQPSLIDWGDGRIQALCRTRAGVVASAWSEDGGRCWSALAKTALPNPNSAVDTVRLADGRAALAYNPSRSRRAPLALAFSDDGLRWRPGPALTEADGSFAYPTILPTREGGAAIVWTSGRDRIFFAALDRQDLTEG